MSAPTMRERARGDCAQDHCENCPFGTVGGLDKRASMERPTWISEADWPEYLSAYQDAARELYGDDWQTCAFGWSLALTIPAQTSGEIAFRAYREKRGGKNHDGSPTPTWADLGDDIRSAWEAAAEAARAS